MYCKCETHRVLLLEKKIIPISGFHEYVKMGIICLKESLFRTELIVNQNKAGRGPNQNRLIYFCLTTLLCLRDVICSTLERPVEHAEPFLREGCLQKLRRTLKDVLDKVQ
jgi:hypothetical protein